MSEQAEAAGAENGQPPRTGGHFSPAVRRLAQEHNVDLAKVFGSGQGGRITRDDVLRAAGQEPPEALEQPPPLYGEDEQEQPQEQAQEQVQPTAEAQAETAQIEEPQQQEQPQEQVEPTAEAEPAQQEEPQEPAEPVAETEAPQQEEPQQQEPAEPVAEAEAPQQEEPPQPQPEPEPQQEPPVSSKQPRKLFEQKVAESVRQSHRAPRMASVFELDAGSIPADSGQDNWQLPARAFAAAAAAMQAVPQFNGRYTDEHLETFQDINIGIGLFIDGIGVVVPVLKRVQDLSTSQIEEQLSDKAARSAGGKLRADDLSGGTFTIYHHVHASTLFSLPPTVYQPQVAALSLGRIQRRAVAVGEGDAETLQIRSMAYAALSVDYRALDWRQADAWITAFTAAFNSAG